MRYMKSPVTWLVVIIIILVGALGYVAGRDGIVLNNPLSSSSPVPSPSVSSPSPTVITASPLASPTPATQKIEAGGILSFPKYRVTIPASWTFSKESNTADDQKLTLKNETSEITFLQGGFGGAACLYPGDPDVEGPAGRYTGYVDLTTASGDKLRRSTPESGSGFAVCYLSQYGWGAPTVYGHISLKTAESPTSAELEMIDTILSSIKKI